MPNYNNKINIFYIRNKDFYNAFLTDNNRTHLIKDDSMKAFQFKKGAIYSGELCCYVAPIDGTQYYEETGEIIRLIPNYWHDYYSFIDNGDRFNIAIHNGEFTDGISGGTDGFLKLTTDGFIDLTKRLTGKVPFNRIRMLTCHSANGGTKSIAAKVAEKTGMPTSGYRGTVTTLNAKAVSKAQKATDTALDRSKVATRNFFRQYPDGSFRPTALEKEFHPSFGSPGFDDMGSFLDGVFI